MRTARLLPLALALSIGLTPATGAFAAAAKPAPSKAASLKLERVVMLMRHSVRPPTKADVTPPGWAAAAWPAWSTPFGDLTAHGKAGAKLMGAYDGSAFRARGLLRAGCPAQGVVAVWASGKSRAIETAQNYVEGMFPGCGIKVEHPVDENNDPVFHPADTAGALAIDGQIALAAVRARLPAGGVQGLYAWHKADFPIMQRVMGCAPAGCNLAGLPSDVVAAVGDGPDLMGALGVASTAGQTVLLEYVEGKPMSEVGWGRASKADIAAMLRFHTTKFYVEARAPYVAERAAAPIATRILAALNGEAGTGRLTLLVGHDTNIAQLGGMFDLHWQIADYPRDDPPPGGAIGFELLRDASGHRFVHAFYEAQSMDQLRNLTPLTAKRPPARVYIPITGCTTKAAQLCPFATFQKIVRHKLDHPAAK